jgi:hypothetical protein
MSSWIRERTALVACLSNDLSIRNKNSAKWSFATRTSVTTELNCLTKEGYIVGIHTASLVTILVCRLAYARPTLLSRCASRK